MKHARSFGVILETDKLLNGAIVLAAFIFAAGFFVNAQKPDAAPEAASSHSAFRYQVVQGETRYEKIATIEKIEDDASYNIVPSVSTLPTNPAEANQRPPRVEPQNISIPQNTRATPVIGNSPTSVRLVDGVFQTATGAVSGLLGATR